MAKEKRSGIYVIENLVNGKKYVGSGFNAEKRMKDSHRESIALWNAIKKYGKNSFKRYVLEYCNEDIMIEREAFWIEELHSHVSEWGYNIMRRNDLTKRTGHSDDTKEKMSKKKKGIPLSEETCLAMSEGHKGLHPSEETRKKMGEWQMGENNNMYGKHPSEEYLKKKSEDEMGEKNPFWGRHHSDISKEKIRASKIGKKASQETRDLMSRTRTGKIRKKNKNASSIFFGVYRKINGKYKRWASRVWENGKEKNIGYYKTEIEAAESYDNYVVEHNLARPLNFPEKYMRSK